MQTNNQWRQFNFFDVTPIRDPLTKNGSPLFSDPYLTAACSGRESVFLATADGLVKQISKDIQLLHVYNIHDDRLSDSDGYTIQHLKCLPNTSLLLTVSVRTGHPVSVRLWNLDRFADNPQSSNSKSGSDSSDGGLQPRLLHLHSMVTVHNGSNTYPLSAFAISQDNNLLAFGFADGAVIVVRGDIVHDRGSRQRLVYKSSIPITGVAFEHENTSVIFVTTLNRVITVSTSGRNNGKPEAILDKSNGANLGCVALDEAASHSLPVKQFSLVIARTKDLSWYSSNRSGPSFALDVPKKALYSYKQYFVIVVDPRADSPVSASSSTQTSTSAIQSLVQSDYVRVLIIDTIGKFIVYSGQISKGVGHVFTQWDALNIISSDGVLYRFHEKSLANRIDILERSRLYQSAIDMARQYNTETKDIYKRYGDFLYDEDKKEQALEQYCQCIDAYNSSHVIVKYRDSQYVALLSRYLEAVLDTDIVTTNHVSLLLNCYAKTKNLEKFEQLLRSSIAADEPSTIDKPVRVDPSLIEYEVAISLCRKVGCHELAAQLADQNGDCDLAVQLYLTEFNNPKGTLDYIETLDVKDALRILITYSREFLDYFPVRTSVLLIALFTGKYTPKRHGTGAQDQFSRDIEADYMSYAAPVLQSYRAFVNYVASKTLSNDGNYGNGPHSNVSDAASISRISTLDTRSSTDLSRRSTGTPTQGSSHEDKTTAEERFVPTYQPPRPRLIFASFLNHPYQFVIFLEACLESSDTFEADERDQSDIVSALIESYLQLAKVAKDAESKSAWETKALDLLTAKKAVVKPNTIALIKHVTGSALTQDEHEDDDGTNDIDALRSSIAVDDIEGVKRIMTKVLARGDFFTNNTNNEAKNNLRELHVLMLSYLVSSKPVLDQCTDLLEKLLDQIKKERTLAPLQVFQILSTKSVATVGHVRNYLVELINSEESEILRNEQLAHSYRKESEEKKAQINDMLTKTATIDPQKTQCELCHITLDLPCVHFACGHAYHQRCLDTSMHATSSTSPSCPRCLSEYDNIKMLRKAQEEVAQRDDLFESALKDSEFKFRVVTDFVGHGALSSMLL